MQHSIQQLMDKVSAMHTLAVQAHREKYKKAKGEPYDVQERFKFFLLMKMRHLMQKLFQFISVTLVCFLRD